MIEICDEIEYELCLLEEDTAALDYMLNVLEDESRAAVNDTGRKSEIAADCFAKSFPAALATLRVILRDINVRTSAMGGTINQVYAERRAAAAKQEGRERQSPAQCGGQK